MRRTVTSPGSPAAACKIMPALKMLVTTESSSSPLRAA
jgi:hypothetical protein